MTIVVAAVLKNVTNADSAPAIVEVAPEGISNVSEVVEATTSTVVEAAALVFLNKNVLEAPFTIRHWAFIAAAPGKVVEAIPSEALAGKLITDETHTCLAVMLVVVAVVKVVISPPSINPA